MADFCKQCSILMFGEDFGDLASEAEHWPEGAAAITVLCEGCGAISVDRSGKCLDHTDAEHADAILRGIMPKGDASTE